ncbi:DUF4959 domain-containing protein [Bacteroides oleiciplenus]|uniref:DUF4959 domain-containing protein n=2 Tax=Bacteroides oleiciplenus TaxID=626931 RepID=A0A3E5BRN6_9BACE|nr:DUF4959 domain-containing protein [Bacteroides oleiciplenus]
MKTLKMKLTCSSVIIAIILFIGCDDISMKPITSGSDAPGMITNISVENQPGQAVITYSIPKNQNILYIKAVYPLANGETREVKASYYTNKIVVDGFADTNEHTIKLYAVNRSESSSEPAEVTIKPLENPIWEVFRSLKILPDFAGVKIRGENPTRANIAVEVLEKDTLGNWQMMPSIYTSAMEFSRTNRGLDTIPYNFAVTVRDRFLNYTDTIYETITPFFEEKIDMSRFTELKLTGDAEKSPENPSLPGLSSIWMNAPDYKNWQRFMTGRSQTDPQFVTFNMNKEVKLSRIKITNFGESSGNVDFYVDGHMRVFEIWGLGKNELINGDWSDDWQLLGRFENIKPSGLPLNQNSSEDIEAGRAGFDYDFDTEAGKVQYIRIKCIENWVGTTWFQIQSIVLFGDTRG